MKDKIIYFWLDILEFFGNIEMRIKHKINKKYFDNLTKEDIPEDTFYCYGGCRFNSKYCPFMDYSIIAKSKYCHYIKSGISDMILYDDCKICGENEPTEE